MHDELDVAIIGGGAAGALVAIHLARHDATPLRVAIVEAGPGPVGTGTAYRTADPAHRMNVRASGLSAFPDEPDDFVDWLGGGADRHGFAARAQFGAYLHDRSKRGDGPHRVTEVTAGARGLTREGDRWRIRLDDGTGLLASAVVLATGVEPPSVAWAPPHLRNSPRFVADPWQPGALDRIGAGEPVTIVGTGLTAVDVALTLDGDRPVTALSRHGRLPYGHTPVPLPGYPVDEPLPATRPDLRALLRRRIATSLSATGDWRPAIDGIRPVAQRIWSALPDRDRALFVRHDVRRWEAARHRMAPEVATRIEAMRATGRLTVTRGDARTATLPADTWVVNATGPDAQVTRSRNPLLRYALAGRIASPGPLGLGLDTTADGQLRDAGGRPVPGLWTLGCLRRGTLWETTAISEIRTQAAALAERLATRSRTG